MEEIAIEREIMDKAKEWISDYGEEFLVELIDVYLNEAPGQLAQLQAAVAGNDAETVSREAHSLKSSSANLGAMMLAAMARELEVAGRNGDTASLAAGAAQLTAAFAQVKTVLEALRREAAGYLGQER